MKKIIISFALLFSFYVMGMEWSETEKIIKKQREEINKNLQRHNEWLAVINDQFEKKNEQRDCQIKLFYAIEGGYAWAVKEFLLQGANPNGRVPGAKSSITPLKFAVIHGMLSLCKSWCLKEAWIRISYSPKDIENKFDIIKELIAEGADVNAQDENSEEYPLYTLIERGNNLEEVKLLLKNGARVDSKNTSEGYTPLHAVTFLDNQDTAEEIITLLLKNGADIDATTRYWDVTPLILSMQLRKEKIATILINKGANTEKLWKTSEPGIVSRRDVWVPLRVMAQRYNLEQLKALL